MTEKQLPDVKALLRRLYQDEEGLETLQVVMITAVAAIIVAAIFVFWRDIKRWAGRMLGRVTRES